MVGKPAAWLWLPLRVAINNFSAAVFGAGDVLISWGCGIRSG
jgi:hypothetical protein